MLDKKGFTLVEIIVVLVIVSILAAVSIPSYITYIDQGYAQNAINNAQVIILAEKNYYLSNGTYCASVSGMDPSACLGLSLQKTFFTGYTCLLYSPPSYSCTINTGNAPCTSTYISINQTNSGQAVTCTGSCCPSN